MNLASQDGSVSITRWMSAGIDLLVDALMPVVAQSPKG
jgi:hypothetical protein